MMKRIYAFFLILIIAAGFVLPCDAAIAISEREDSVAGDVYARSIKDIPWEEVDVNNGTAVVTTDNGYTITVIDIPAEAVILRVFPIPSSESSAWNWMTDCIGEKYDIQDAFDICFEDVNGNRINVDGVKITIQGCDNDCSIFSVRTTSHAEELDDRNENGAIQFTADGSHYYVLTKMVSAEPSTGPTDSAGVDKSTLPATGDDNDLWLCGILVIVLSSALMRRLLLKKVHNARGITRYVSNK